MTAHGSTLPLKPFHRRSKPCVHTGCAHHRQSLGMESGEAACAQRLTTSNGSNLFQEVDIAVCPPMPCSAFQHDHAPQRSRQLEIDGRARSPTMT